MTEVARHLGVTRPALSRVLNGKAGVSADMALRISEAFNTDPELWLRLQAQRDLWVASRKKRAKVKPLIESAAAYSGFRIAVPKGNTLKSTRPQGAATSQ